MNHDDTAGARAAAVYFFTLYPYTMSTLDTAELDAICDYDMSEYCRRVRDVVHEYKEDGTAFAGGGLQVEVIATHDVDELTGTWSIDIKAGEEPIRLTKEHGRSQRFDAQTTTARVVLSHDESGWHVIGAGDIPKR